MRLSQEAVLGKVLLLLTSMKLQVRDLIGLKDEVEQGQTRAKIPRHVHMGSNLQAYRN